MTDEELLQHKKVGVAVAAEYLQNGTTAQEIRVQAQNGISPFCTAEKMRGRYRYRINPGLLIKYKRGELGLILPKQPPQSARTEGGYHAESKIPRRL